MDYTKERKQYAAMVAFYVGEISASSKKVSDTPMDSLQILGECVDFAEAYEFTFEEDGVTISTEVARNDAVTKAEEICNKYMREI